MYGLILFVLLVSFYSSFYHIMVNKDAYCLRF